MGAWREVEAGENCFCPDRLQCHFAHRFSGLFPGVFIVSVPAFAAPFPRLAVGCYFPLFI